MTPLDTESYIGLRDPPHWVRVTAMVRDRVNRDRVRVNRDRDRDIVIESLGSSACGGVTGSGGSLNPPTPD